MTMNQNDDTKAVPQDPKNYEKMCKAVDLLQLMSKGEDDIRRGNVTTQEDVFKKLASKLTKQ